ncbi:MAG: hypothetical protein ACM3PZ_01175 [Bacillota bacterium]
MNSLEMPSAAERHQRNEDIDPRPELEQYRVKLRPHNQYQEEERQEMERLRKLILQDSGVLPPDPSPTPQELPVKKSFLELLGFQKKHKNFSSKSRYDN